MTGICVTCFAIVDCSFFLIFFTCLYSLKWFCRNDRKLVFRLRAIDEKTAVTAQTFVTGPAFVHTTPSCTFQYAYGPVYVPPKKCRLAW